jgi:hypothetical protein
MNDQRLRADAETGDRYEVVDGVVRQLAIGMRRGDEGRVSGHQEGITVGCGSRDGFGADLADAPAGPVLDHDLLTPGLREPLSQRAADDVGDAAGGKRHDDMNGFDGISLR